MRDGRLRQTLTLILLAASWAVLAACAGAGAGSGAPSAGSDPSPTAEASSAEQVVVLDEGPPAPGTTATAPGQSAASFDYYVLALSWSPEHCATPVGRRDTTQCSGPRPFGFIVHGLWPQFERGWPQDCGGGPPLSRDLIRATMDIMPSERLIRHEWTKHGTCSGLDPAGYFALARQAFASFQTPPGYGTPTTTLNVKPATYKQALLEANPGWTPRSFALICSGRFLQEVRVCLDKNLQPRPCGNSVRDRCNVPEMIVRPLR